MITAILVLTVLMLFIKFVRKVSGVVKFGVTVIYETAELVVASYRDHRKTL